MAGVNKETMRFFDTKTKIDISGKPVSLGYSYPNGSFKVRSLTEKSFHSVGEINKAGLFGVTSSRLAVTSTSRLQKEN